MMMGFGIIDGKRGVEQQICEPTLIANSYFSIPFSSSLSSTPTFSYSILFDRFRVCCYKHWISFFSLSFSQYTPCDLCFLVVWDFQVCIRSILSIFLPPSLSLKVLS